MTLSQTLNWDPCFLTFSLLLFVFLSFHPAFWVIFSIVSYNHFIEILILSFFFLFGKSSLLFCKYSLFFWLFAQLASIFMFKGFSSSIWVASLSICPQKSVRCCVVSGASGPRACAQGWWQLVRWCGGESLVCLHPCAVVQRTSRVFTGMTGTPAFT